MPTRAPTKSSTPRLSEAARHVVIPDGVVSTGWPAVRDKCAELGITFRPWQHGAGQVILAKRADGKYAATVGGTGLSIPRQVGKTYLIAAIVFALCLLRPGLTVIWTAHRLRTAEETFGKMQVFAKRRTIAPHMLRPILGSGEEEIRFRNGSRIMFGARERGFGRGFDEVDVLIYDEAQILGENALDDMVPATNQSRQGTGALLLFLGTPPKPTDNGEVFKRMRSEALSGEDSDTGWVEFGADPGYSPTPLPAPLSKADWEQVAKANPSYPQDTPREAILRMRKKLGPDSFLREGLGIWDDGGHGKVIDPRVWADLADEDFQPVGALAFAVETDMAREWSALAAIGPYCECDGADCACTGRFLDIIRHSPGTSWVLDRAVELAAKYPGVPFVVDKGGPAASLIADLKRAGVNVVEAATTDVAAAYGLFMDAIRDRTLRHGDVPPLNAAVAVCKTRPCGDGGKAFGRKVSGADISTLQAASLANWAAVSIASGPPAVWLLSEIVRQIQAERDAAAKAGATSSQ